MQVGDRRLPVQQPCSNPRNYTALPTRSDAHHLPEYYIGEAENDVREAEEAACLIEGITYLRDWASLSGDLAAARQLLEDWLAFSQERGTGFDKWCRLRERQYTWRNHYYYSGGRFDNSD